MKTRIALAILLGISLHGQPSRGIWEGRAPAAAKPVYQPPPPPPKPVYQAPAAPKPVYQPPAAPANQSGQAAYERLRQMQEEQRRMYERQVRNSFDRSRAAAQLGPDASLNDALGQYQQIWNTMSAEDRQEVKKMGGFSPDELRRMMADDASFIPTVDPARPDFENGAGSQSLTNLSNVENTLKKMEQSDGCTEAIRAQIADLTAKRDRYKSALRDIEGAYADASANAGAGKSLAESALWQAGVETVGSTADAMYSLLDAVTSVYKPKLYENVPGQGQLNEIKKLREAIDNKNALDEGGAAGAKAGVNSVANVLPISRTTRDAIKSGGGALIDAGDKLANGDGGAAVGATSQAASEALKYMNDKDPANTVAGAGTLTQAGSDAMKGNYIQAAGRVVAGGAQVLSAALPENKQLKALKTAGSTVASYDKSLKSTTDNYFKRLDDARELDGVLGSSRKSIAERRNSVASQLQSIETQLNALQARCTQILLP